MAIIKEMLGEREISGFRGKVDFYYYMGIPCARQWPRKPTTPRNPQVVAAQQPFIEAAQLAKTLSPEIIAFYKENAASTSLTWKDLFFRSYMSGLPTEFYTGKD